MPSGEGRAEGKGNHPTTIGSRHEARPWLFLPFAAPVINGHWPPTRICRLIHHTASRGAQARVDALADRAFPSNGTGDLCTTSTNLALFPSQHTSSNRNHRPNHTFTPRTSHMSLWVALAPAPAPPTFWSALRHPRPIPRRRTNPMTHKTSSAVPSGSSTGRGGRERRR